MKTKKLNFCSGNDIKESWDNADIQKNEKIFFCDANKFPYPFQTNTYEYILIKQTLHMLISPEKVLKELRRICKPQGVIEIEVPHYTNKGANTDILTKHYFSEATFHELINQSASMKKLNEFKIQEIKLNPTIIGKIFPKPLRNKLSLFINGLISTINIKLIVIK